MGNGRYTPLQWEPFSAYLALRGTDSIFWVSAHLLVSFDPCDAFRKV